MAVKTQVEFFWVGTTCSVVVGYKCFRGPCCHLPSHFLLANGTCHPLAL